MLWMALAVFQSAYYYKNLNKGLVFLVPLSLLLPVLSSLAGFSLASVFSLTYNPLFVLTPLLPLALGESFQQ